MPSLPGSRHISSRPAGEEGRCRFGDAPLRPELLDLAPENLEFLCRSESVGTRYGTHRLTEPPAQRDLADPQLLDHLIRPLDAPPEQSHGFLVEFRCEVLPQ